MASLIKRKNESNKHFILKKIGKRILKTYYDIPDHFIYDEAAIKNIKFDLLAYPPPEFSASNNVVAVECGNISSGFKNTFKRIEEMMESCMYLIWLPYDLYDGTIIDTIGRIINGIAFIPFPIKEEDENFNDLINDYRQNFSNNGPGIFCMLVTKENRLSEKFKDLKNKRLRKCSIRFY